MTELFSTVCEQCGARLKLKNPDLEGKKIKCPKCGEAFVVRAVGTPATKKKKPETDDDLGFMDLDSDDLGPAPDDDEEDLFESPRRKTRSKGAGGKKVRKKSKSSSASVVPMLALFLVAALVLGGGAYGLTLLLQGDGSSDVDWLPGDIQGYAKIQVDGLWNAAVFQGVKGTPGGQKFVEEMTKSLGVGPQDVDVMIVGMTASRTSSVIVIRSRKALDAAAVQSSEKLQSASHNWISYLTNNRLATYLPNSTTLIRGPEAAIKSLLERGKKNPSEAKFAFARGYRDHVVIAMSGASSSMSSLFPRGNGNEMLLRGNASSEIRISAQETYGSADAARTQSEKMKSDIEKGKSEMSRAKTQLASVPANPLVKTDQIAKLIAGAEQVLNSVQVSQSGTRVNVQATISGQLMTDFVELSSSGGPRLPGLSLPF